MKNIKRILCVIITVLVVFPLLQINVTAVGAKLITIDGVSVYEDWTQNDVAAAFGTPKLITPSAFGGSAYTYYGSNYGRFLYIETDNAGKIVSYSTFTPDYVTSNNSYGDVLGNSISMLMGDFVSNSQTNRIWAGCYYNCTRQQFEQYISRWKADPDKYLAGLQKQASLMMKALAKVLDNKNVNPVFNETLFNANSALKEQNSDLYSYSNSTGKSQYVQLISMGTEFFIGFSHLPNPLMYAQYARRFTIKSNMTYGCFDFTFNQDGSASSGTYFVDAAILDNGTYVEMTAQEKALLKNAREIYNQSTQDFNAASEGGYFQTEYQYKNCPLTAGVMKPLILKSTLEYINAIRAGADLPLLSLSQQLSNGAQAKAVLTSYLGYNNISNPSPHFPPQPNGVSDAFYALTSIGNGENLYMTSMLGGDFVIGSIEYALQEAYGDTIACGHRYNLLDPNWVNIGFGVCNGQGVHKMDGYKSSDVDMVAWPSKGIMLTDANLTPPRWSAKFYNGSYKTTASTSVTVKNLNTGTSWVITPEDDLQFVGTSLISYRDPAITYSNGDICQITINNLIKDGLPAKYVYRTVFASIDSDNSNATGTLKGTVTSYGNNTSENTKITVYNGTTVIASTTVSGSGAKAYKITGLPYGIYTVKVSKKDHITKEYTVAIIKAEAVKNLEIKIIGEVTGITVDPKSKAMTAAGETFTITAAVAPADALDKSVVFSSSNNSVAKVNASTGVVTAVANGTAIITATTASGGKTDTCTVTVNIPHAHVWEEIDSVASTCIVKGHNHYWHCTACGKYYKDNKSTETSVAAETLSLAAHKLTYHPAVAASHNATGNVKYWTCTVCNKYFLDESGTVATTANAVVTGIISHSYGSWQNNTTHHWHECSCGSIKDKSVHDFIWIVDTVATEEAAGSKHEKCKICGFKRNEGTVIPKLTHDHKHTWEEIPAKVSTCLEKGNNRYFFCNTCGMYCKENKTTETTVIAETLALAAHKLTYHPPVAASEIAEGNIQYWTCDVCGKYFSNAEGTAEITKDEIVIAIIPPSYDSWQKDAVSHWLESDGTVTDVAAHTYEEWTETVPATEFSTGEKQRICSVCGYIETAEIPALTHIPAAEWTFDDTNHWHACTECSELTDKAEHNYGEWNVTKEANTVENGCKEHICSVCGYKETVEIPKTEAAATSPDSEVPNNTDPPGNADIIGLKERLCIPLVALAVIILLSIVFIFVILIKKERKE